MIGRRRTALNRVGEWPMMVLLVLLMMVPTIEVRGATDEFTQRIKDMEKEIERKRKELEKGETALKQLKTEEKKSLTDIGKIDRTIENITSNLNTIRKEEKTIDSDVSSAQRDYDATSARLGDRSSNYAGRIREMYKRQRISPIGMLVSAGSVSGAMRGFRMLSAVAKADLTVVTALRGDINDIERSMARLRDALTAKRALARAKEREQLSLKSSRQKKQTILKEIQKDEAQQEQLNKRYTADIENSRRQLDTFIREREKSKTPVAPSLKGFDVSTLKGKLPWPAAGAVVSKFGRQVDPRTRTATTNRGIEIETRPGEPVTAIARGEVVMTQFFRGYGNFVMIFHPPSYYSTYGHLSDFVVDVGKVVNEGDVIGLAGSTGLIDESSSRLIFELLREETPLDPLLWLTPESRRAAR